MTLTQIQKDLLFGTLLGDGNLSTGSGGRTWRYRAVHGKEQKDYLFHKYEILENLCNTPPSRKERESSSLSSPSLDWKADSSQLEKQKSTNYFFNTLTNPSLRFYGNMFYTYNKKTHRWVRDVPKKVQLFLTPRALAYLHMDDGGLKWLGHSNAMRISTEGFSHAGVKRLQNALQHSFNIYTTTTKKSLSSSKFENFPVQELGTPLEKAAPTGRPSPKEAPFGLIISIPEASSGAYRELIKPYLVDCMKHKVSDGKRGHL